MLFPFPRVLFLKLKSIYLRYWEGQLRDRSLFKCQGGRLKSRGGGGHVNFHVVSRGVAFNFDLPVGGGGGVMLI